MAPWFTQLYATGDTAFTEPGDKHERGGQHMQSPSHLSTATAALAISSFLVLLAGCGGGGGSTDPAPPPPPPPTAGPTEAQRIAAATTTANSHAKCTAVAPFFWEVGDRSAARASGSVLRAGDSTRVEAGTPMALASATKWLFGAYVVQKRGGVLSADEVRYLHFRSGHTSFVACLPGQTVDACLAFPAANGAYTAANDGRFFYDGGHMQKLASLVGLGAMGNAALAAEFRSVLGDDLAFTFSQPQLAGAAQGTPDDYTRFLRRLLDGRLRLGELLGTQAVCTNPATCLNAVATPVPASESWSYSLGHWVETDPVVGDGASSSAGAFGFYPWIDATRTWYGVLARQAAAGSGNESADCGRLIRKAWVTGVAP
jgi:hypothetical protein